MDEYLDLVNERDEVIGKKPRSEAYAEGLSNFRVINLFIINSRGELWVPRRTAHKALFPSCLDMGVAGHVESGETYEQTLVRETREEINTDITAIGYRLLGMLTPQADQVSAFMAVYEAAIDAAPPYNPDDFCEYFWLTPAQLLERIEKGERAKSDLPKLVRRFYAPQ